MKTRIRIIGVLTIIVLALAIKSLFGGAGEDTSNTAQINGFVDCVAEGNPVMESYPRQCRAKDGTTFVEDTESEKEEVVGLIDPTLTERDARALAEQSALCLAEGEISLFETYNANSGTWWYSLSVEKPRCNPACVVYDQTLQTAVNWRCTGLNP